MQVGDVVIPIPPVMLASGSGYHDCAIVVHMTPLTFALSSVDGDMVWLRTIEPEDVKALCQADAKLVKRLVKAFELRYMKTVKVKKRSR